MGKQDADHKTKSRTGHGADQEDARLIDELGQQGRHDAKHHGDHERNRRAVGRRQADIQHAQEHERAEHEIKQLFSVEARGDADRDVHEQIQDDILHEDNPFQIVEEDPHMVHDICRTFIYERARIPSFYAGTSHMARGRTLGSRQEHREEKATPPPNNLPARERHRGGANTRKRGRRR